MSEPETAHTPGPWIFSYSTDTIRVHRQGRHKAEECITVINNTRDAANARLIAAAPDLLAILRRLVFAADARLLSHKHKALEDARAAIARATGGKE